MTAKSTNTVKAKPAVPSKEDRERVNTILARTDWGKYWAEVSSRVEPEVEAYDSARARSLANASRRILR